MKKISVLIIIGLIVIGVYIVEPFRSEPYTPIITTREDVIPTTQGSYCWNALVFAQCVDKVYTSPVEMAKEHQPTVVSPKQEIKIKFKKEPLPGTLKIEQVSDESNMKIAEVNNDAISAPNEQGVYFYHVIANWKQGDGNYAFSIEVK